ncbi:MAG: hypothetical protein Q8M17_06265 [Actinomycetota bacterium]|nr:hypothetical protein [Actinomycetota bacterium]
MPSSTRRPLALLLAVVGAWLLVLTAPGASASAPAAPACCGNVQTVFKQVVPVDGSTYANEAVGQVRVSNGTIEDAQGDQIGTFSASHTILSINPATGMRKVQNSCTITLGNGSIMTSGIDFWPVGSAPASGTENTVAIVGGTGFYAGATGVAKQTLMANGFYKTRLIFKNAR